MSLRKLKRLVSMIESGRDVEVTEGEVTRDYNPRTDGFSPLATYRIKRRSNSPRARMRPGQVWRLRSGELALIVRKKELGGYPSKEYTYFTESDDDAFNRCDEEGMVGPEDSPGDLVELVSSNPRDFFNDERMVHSAPARRR